MNTPKILGIVRHVLTLVGGLLVALGFISEDVLAQGIDVVLGFVGAGLALWAFIASFKSPEKNISEASYQALKSK